METGGVSLRPCGFPGWGDLLSGNAFHTDSVPPAEISGRLLAQSRKSLSCRGMRVLFQQAGKNGGEESQGRLPGMDGINRFRHGCYGHDLFKQALRQKDGKDRQHDFQAAGQKNGHPCNWHCQGGNCGGQELTQQDGKKKQGALQTGSLPLRCPRPGIISCLRLRIPPYKGRKRKK